jgi:hypothetical protein
VPVLRQELLSEEDVLLLARPGSKGEFFLAATGVDPQQEQFIAGSDRPQDHHVSRFGEHAEKWVGSRFSLLLTEVTTRRPSPRPRLPGTFGPQDRGGKMPCNAILKRIVR